MKPNFDCVRAANLRVMGAWLCVCALFAPSVFAYPLLVQQTANTPLLALSFSDTPRLSQALLEGTTALKQTPAYQASARSHQTDGIFWPAAGLFDRTQQDSIDALKSEAITLLSGLSAEWADDAEKTQAIDALSTFVETQAFGFRVPVDVDYDTQLLGKQANPLLDANYTLVLPPRPSSIGVLGAVQHSGASDWVSGFSISEYLDRHDRLFWYAERSHVVVIQPNGKTLSVPVAYWNSADAHLIPGSLVYVPFTSLPSEFERLNTTIVNLLTHRMM